MTNRTSRNALIAIAVLGLCIVGSPCLTAGEVPADFPKTGLALWLSAGDVKVEKDAVVQINDRSGQENHAAHSQGPKTVLANPVVVKEAANGQPVLRFSGENSSFIFKEIANIRTVFMVVSKDPKAFKQKSELLVLGGVKTLDFHPGTHFTDTILHATPQYGSPALQKGRAWLNGNVIEARSTDWPQKLSVVSLQSTADVRADQLARDREFPDRCWHGDIAEILIYSTALSDVDRQTVERYLFRKYAIEPGKPSSQATEGKTKDAK
jgi:hypothetical protein